MICKRWGWRWQNSLRDGDDLVQGGSGDDRIDGGEGTDAAIYRGDKAEFTIKRIRDIVTVQDHRKKIANDIDQLENVETFLFHDGEITLQQLNKGPVLTGEKGLLKDGYKNWRYVINESTLGYADPMRMYLRSSTLNLWGSSTDLAMVLIPSSKFEERLNLSI